jgi:hemoglobin-like flavoprotein
MLTANEIALVRASFARVVPIQSAAADLFYDRLFAISPKLRELFPADLRAQKHKLMQMISTAVGGLNDLNHLVPAVKALGARHSGYGVTMEHYRLVGEALLWTLERSRFHAGGSLRLGQCLPHARRNHASGRGGSRQRRGCGVTGKRAQEPASM